MDGASEGQADPVEAGELADLLQIHQIPAMVLNACQSGMQVGDTETSLGARLMAAGAQVVLAMGYSVTVSAAELLMGTLYERLFAGSELPEAIDRARLELHSHKTRRAYFNHPVELEDWLLPVVYQNQPLSLALVDFATPEQRNAYYERRAARYPFPQPEYGFFGRDLDVLEIERRLLSEGEGPGPDQEPHNILLMRGMGGVGKTTLLHHLGAWWQATGLVEEVFYFGYDQRAWTCEQIQHNIARQWLGEARYQAEFIPMSERARAEWLAERLRAERCLLALDNLESITGANLAIQNTLPEAEQEALRAWLAALRDGRTLVLLGSRGAEEWLMEGEGGQTPPSSIGADRGVGPDGGGSGAHIGAPLRGGDVYDLPGLDPQAASELAQAILERHGVGHYRADPDFQRLLKLLKGYPLPLQVVLANLKSQTPAQVVDALEAGAPGVDKDETSADPFAAKTESILRCIEYSFSNLSPEAQGLLACLAPFTGVLDANQLGRYTERLKAQLALSALPFERWTEVLLEAANWGLLAPHPEIQVFLRLQPTLPYFLRARLNAPGNEAQRGAIETAFREHYDGMGAAIAGLLTSKEPQERQLGRLLAALEYENLSTALDLALTAQVSVFNPYSALCNYWDATHDHRRALETLTPVFAFLETYSPEALEDQLGFEFVAVLDNIALRQLLLKQYAAAGETYQKTLDLIAGLRGVDETLRGKMKASTYHQLGMVAQEQRQWKQAEGYYQQALEIQIEFDDRYSQASTYHQLGRVAQEQRQWKQAQDLYLKALETFVAFQDRHSLGIVLRSLARLWQASGEASLPAAVAGVLGISEAEAEELLRGAGGWEEQG
jgi:tetratricopeptide (TPR) repeat protein